VWFFGWSPRQNVRAFDDGDDEDEDDEPAA
jgi:hypothetical protein